MAVQLSQNQKLFASALSQSTGLDPRTVEAWMIAEEPAGAQSGYKGTQDWLNVGITDSGPQGSGNSVWQDPVAAGKATANWIKGTWSDPGFGTASSGIQSILRTKGQSPQAQLAAIAGSGWASSGYGGTAKLQSLLNEIGNSGLPGVTPGGGPTSNASLANPKMVNAKFGSSAPAAAPSGPSIFDVLAGLESTRQRIRGDTSGPDALQSGWDALSNLFKGQQANQAAESNAQNRVNGVQQVNTVGPQPSGTSGKGSDVNPLQHFTLGRTDMGVDANAPPGTPIVAPNTGRVVGVSPNWYKGQPYVELEILDGPNAGKVMYVAEQITDIPRVGQVIPRGQAIAKYAPSGTGIEIGWANPKNPSQTQAQATTGYTEGQQTPAGKAFLQYLQGLGA